MTKDHSKDVAEYKQEMQKAQDPGVKNYVSETLPVIENHLQRAHDLAGKRTKGRVEIRSRSSLQRENTAPCGNADPFHPCGHCLSAKLNPTLPSTSRNDSSKDKAPLLGSNFSR